MQTVYWPGSDALHMRCTVATLGVFDGVHLGHRRVIERVTETAGEVGCSSCVVTFDRHPGSTVRDDPKPALTSLQHRLHIFEALGVDRCVVLRFGEQVARLSALQFAEQVFRDLLSCRHLVLGFDSRFGRGREGDAEFCRSVGPAMGFAVEEVAPVTVDGKAVHSTRIRELVHQGDVAGAAALLGRPYSLYGAVVSGDGRGGPLGFPTANLDLHNEAVPPDGVYVGRAGLADGWQGAVVSIGTRSTFHHERNAERVVEVHVLDWSGEIYGDDLEVQLIHHIRPQETFCCAEALRERIWGDIKAARQLLAED